MARSPENSPQTTPHLFISQKMYLLPEKTVEEAVRLREEFGLGQIGVEFIPLRWNTISGLVALQKDTGVLAAVSGVTTATYDDFSKDLWNFKTNPKVVKEIMMNIAAIGAQSEPEYTRRFSNHLRLAVALDAAYLAMHEEPTRYLIQQDKFEEWTNTNVLYGRKLGWGPQDNRPHILSWNIQAIKKFIDAWSENGSNIGTILPTDTALRTGLSLPDERKRYDLLRAWEVLQPTVVQFADYNPEKKQEKQAPGQGMHSRQLASLIQEIRATKPETIFTIEVESPEDVRPTLEFLLTQW